MYALGEQLLGITPDTLSDRFRNPVFINNLATKELYIDYGNDLQPSQSTASIRRWQSLFMFDTPKMDKYIKLGFFSKMARLNWGSTISIIQHESDQDTELTYEDKVNNSTTSSVANERYAEIHCWIGGPVSETVAWGIDYTFDIISVENKSTQDDGTEGEIISTNYTISPIGQKSISENTTKTQIKTHIARLGVKWNISQKVVFDGALRFEKLFDQSSNNQKHQSLHYQSIQYSGLVQTTIGSGFNSNHCFYTPELLTLGFQGHVAYSVSEAITTHFLFAMDYNYYNTDFQNYSETTTQIIDSDISALSSTQDTASTYRKSVLGNKDARHFPSYNSMVGMGMTWHDGHLLFSAGIKAKVYYGRNHLIMRRYLEENQDGQPIVYLDYPYDIIPRVDYQSFTGEILIPIGMEIMPPKKIAVRFGVLPVHYYERKRNEIKAENVAVNTQESFIDTQFSFGMGYAMLERLQLDLLMQKYLADAPNTGAFRYATGFKVSHRERIG